MKKWESSHAQDPHAQDSTSVPNSDSMFWVASEPSEPCITAQKSVLCSAVSTLKCGNQSVLHGSMKETQHQIVGAGGTRKDYSVPSSVMVGGALEARQQAINGY